LLTRYVGEEIACILPETDFSGAMSIARLLEDRVRKKFIPHARSEVDSVVTISLGVAVRSGLAANEASELLATADEQLYHAKHTGRGRACGRLIGAPAPN
jgi:diguanylate cyclase (GGDEF)-like protein